MNNAHLDFERLAAYWLGELPAAEAQEAEEHFFACEACAERLEWLAPAAATRRASAPSSSSSSETPRATL